MDNLDVAGLGVNAADLGVPIELHPNPTVVGTNFSTFVENENKLKNSRKSKRLTQRASRELPTGVILPFPISRAQLASSTSKSRLLARAGFREPFEFGEIKRHVEYSLCGPERRCKTACTGTRTKSRGDLRNEFSSQKVLEQVGLVEALRCQSPINVHKENTTPELFKFVNAEDRATSIFTCLEFVEKCAKNGLMKDPSSFGEDKLDQSLKFIRSVIFKNSTELFAVNSFQRTKETPVIYANVASSLEVNNADLERELENLKQTLRESFARVTDLEKRELLHNSEMEKATKSIEELEDSEKKQSQYIQRLRKDLMSGFDDLKLMEDARDEARALAKNRSHELADVERKLASQEAVNVVMKAEADLLSDRVRTLEAQIRALEKENRELSSMLVIDGT